MTFEYQGVSYSSKKHPMLEYIFSKYNPNRDTTTTVIPFTLRDISEGYRECNIPEPASISNTILDLTRRCRPIASRLPESIYSLGYDLRKRTGPAGGGQNYAGEFVLVGVGQEIQSWLKWPAQMENKVIPSDPIPPSIRDYIRKDEGALFSVIDYCDILSQVLHDTNTVVLRVQHPVKWQPNEIDGLYFSDIDGEKILYPIEAKALTTRDDLNLEQLRGVFALFSAKYASAGLFITPLAIQMASNGMKIAVFQKCSEFSAETPLNLEKAYDVVFTPVLAAWS